MKRSNHSWWLVAAVVLAVAVASCTTDYVTGKKTFSLVSESEEIATGRDANPQVVAEYGLYPDEELAEFVSQLGQAVARTSHRPQLEYTFQVLDTDMVNAFALPGGWVYMTRGILATFNSQDELAGVVGHEVGHVVARHGAEQMSRQQLAGLGIMVGSVFDQTLTQYAGIGVGLLLLSYSRGQESESDRLGVEYSTKLGYDSHRMADFFRTIDLLSAGQRPPAFLSTHPDPVDRQATVNSLTNDWQQQVDYRPRNTTRHDYYRLIDGIVYGPDPRQGYVENNVFYHPTLRFQFDTPHGWQLNNSRSRVLIHNEEQDAVMQFGIADAELPEQAADKFVAATKAVVASRDRQRVNGYDGVVVRSTVVTSSDTLGVLSYFIHKDDKVYEFHGFTHERLYRRYGATFSATLASFRRVTDTAVLGKKPQRIRIKQVPASGVLSEALRSLGVASGNLEEMALINGRSLNARVEKGEWVKTVSQ